MLDGKIALSIVFLLAINSILAQSTSTESPAGIYHERGNSPEGGTDYVLFPDHQFVVGFFGGMLKGIWEQEGDHINFTTTAVPHYVCYGRYVEGLEETQIRFKGDELNQTLVALNTLEAEMTPVFNDDANCFSPPYTVDFKEEIKKIFVLQAASYLPETPLYAFTNDQNFNQFLIINLQSIYTTIQAFSKPYDSVNGSLNLNGNTRRPLSELSEEDRLFMENLLNTNPFPERLNPGDRYFPRAEDSETTFIGSYTRLQPVTKPKPNITKKAKSLLYFSCEEGE